MTPKTPTTRTSTSIAYDVADLHATIHVRARSSQKLARAIEAAIARATPQPSPPQHIRTIKSRKRAALPTPAAREAATIIVIPVTRRNARHLVTMLESIRFSGSPRGIQLVWDGVTDRDTIEPHVFAALEHARSTPKLAPVILAPNDTPTFALLSIRPSQPDKTAKDSGTTPCR